MTLGRILRILFGESDSVPCPPIFLDLELENYEEQCYFALFKYFKSEKFVKDMESCKLDYDFSTQEGLLPFLHIDRDEEGVITITVNPYLVDDNDEEL